MFKKLPTYTLSVILILPYVFCQHIKEQNVTANVSVLYKDIENRTKLMSEGGIILINNTVPNLPNESALNLSKVGENFKKISSVVRKNGVKFTSEELAALNATRDQQVQDKTPHPHTNHYPKTTNISTENSENNNIKSSLSPAQTTTKKPIVHKPLILSYEALAKMDIKSKSSSLPIINSSFKTMTDQMPSPENDNTLTSKIYSTNPGKHPGMIMPIVITIFVVPMFAVLGYMAVKRGQEAWRNRHYKRMDFLLDGMYND